VQITDTNGCVATSNPIVYSGIADLRSGNIQVFPNPNQTGSWNLVVTANLLGKPVEITDVEGRLLYSSVITNTTSVVHTQLPAGVYLLKLNTGSKTYTHKLIKL
jgi:hypothetical protein